MDSVAGAEHVLVLSIDCSAFAAESRSDASMSQIWRGAPQGSEKHSSTASFTKKLEQVVATKEEVIVGLQNSLSEARQQAQMYASRYTAIHSYSESNPYRVSLGQAYIIPRVIRGQQRVKKRR